MINNRGKVQLKKTKIIKKMKILKGIKFIDVKQNTKEWFDLRLKKTTSSNFSKIMANRDKFGEPAKEYAFSKALEIVTGERDESSNFKNFYMKRGSDFEYKAKIEYEKRMFVIVKNGGFYYNNYLGDSPDGNIGDKGCVEFKVVIPKIQRHIIKNGGFDNSYKWQILGHLLIGNKEWCDFVQYCPEMTENKKLYVYRIYRKDFKDEIEHLSIKLGLFLELIKKEVEFLKNDYECINI